MLTTFLLALGIAVASGEPCEEAMGRIRNILLGETQQIIVSTGDLIRLRSSSWSKKLTVQVKGESVIRVATVLDSGWKHPDAYLIAPQAGYSIITAKELDADGNEIASNSIPVLVVDDRIPPEPNDEESEQNDEWEQEDEWQQHEDWYEPPFRSRQPWWSTTRLL